MQERHSERRETLGYWPVEDTDSGEAVGLVTNLNEEGVQVHSRHGFSKGQVLTIRIEASTGPAGASPIALLVENAWCRASGVPGLYHAGFKVVGISDRARRGIKNLLQAFSYPAPGPGWTKE
jgi:hypothetical protein